MKYSFDSCVRFSEVGEDQKLTLGSVINYFQDCSTFQSESLGAGVEFLRKQHRVWVLSSWQVVIERYPALCEKIRITTWAYGFKRFLGNRNFTMEDEAGNVVASMTGDEVKNYDGNPEDIKVTLENAGNYKVHYEYTAPGMTVTETVNGIDVSHWQNDAGGIDWGAVADAGYKFAMIKVAGRSIGDDGSLYEDNYFRYNIEQATAHGIQVGVYFFSQALSVQEAYEEASYMLNLIKGYNITYPVAFDWETSSGYRTCDRLNKDELTSICEAFCDTVKSHGYQPMIYMSKNDWVNKVHTNRLTSKYNVWLAWYFYKYYNSPSNRLYEDGDEVPDLSFGYNIWQYTSTAYIPGINGACDMNVAFATTYKSGDTKTKDITIRVEKKKGEPETTAPDKGNTTETTTGTTSGTTGAAETSGTTAANNAETAAPVQ